MRKKMGEEKVEQRWPESPVVGKSNLWQVIQTISSLLSLTHSVKVFHVKWQLIRSKLETLNSGLIAAENRDLGENVSFSKFIKAILVTVNECNELARRCVNLSYSGKLLMQSDLDVVSSKFEVHLKSLSGVYTSGILTQGNAIVVSKPCVDASRDDMRFYVGDLLTRLKVGGSKMKIQALVALNEIVQEDEKYVKILIETGEIISLLVKFLELREMEIQEESAKAVLVIAGLDSYKGVLVEAGIIGSLICVLESGSDLGKERAVRTLKKLTENSENAWSVSAHGGVPALLKICSNGDGRGDLMSPACGVLKNLARVEEIKRFIVEEGAVLIFIKLMNSRDEVLLLIAIEFLQIIASGDEPICQMFIREGGIYSLVRVLDQKNSFSSKAREIALKAIESFCYSSPNSLKILLGYGFLDRILFFLRNNDEVSVQELAVKAAFHLSGTSEEIKKAMGVAGFMPVLMRLFDSRSFEVREMAVEAISNMVLVQKNRRRFVEEDNNVDRILQLLDPEEWKSGNKRFFLSTLMSLTSSNSGRRKISNSRYLKNLEKLAEADVMDAKRVIKKLSTNRFRSILNGIWNS